MKPTKDWSKPTKMWSNEYIIGWVLFLTSLYLSSEDRPVSASLFALAAIVAWVVDLVKKVIYVNHLRKQISKKTEEKNDEKE
jgi:hypothetical protein